MFQKGEKVQNGEDFPKFKYLKCGFAFDDILVTCTQDLVHTYMVYS